MDDRPGPTLWAGTPLRTLDEDELLARILPTFPRSDLLEVPPGDDAAVLRTDPSTIATTDTMVLGRDWVDAWSSGADVGAKVIAQNLADVSAMGGRPTGVLLTFVADPAVALEWVLDLTRGIARACAAADVPVLGGDLSSAPDGVVMVSVTALGTLEGRAPVLRSGARPGDVLAVHGTLGHAAAGLELLRQGRVAVDPEVVAVQRRPSPPLAAGPAAALAGATSMLDVSDGLLRDGGRIARASGVVLDVDRGLLRTDVERLTPALGDDLALRCVLSGGEEHSLLATFGGEPPPGWRRLGTVRAVDPGEPAGILVDGHPVSHQGWDHFRPD